MVGITEQRHPDHGTIGGSCGDRNYWMSTYGEFWLIRNSYGEKHAFKIEIRICRRRSSRDDLWLCLPSKGGTLGGIHGSGPGHADDGGDFDFRSPAGKSLLPSPLLPSPLSLPSLLRRIWLPRVEMHGLARSNAWRRFSCGTPGKENRRSRARPGSALCWARQRCGRGRNAGASGVREFSAELRPPPTTPATRPGGGARRLHRGDRGGGRGRNE
jgi:hypothetical protein